MDLSIPVLELKNVGLLNKDIWVIKNLSLTLMPGQKMALVQMSGMTIRVLFDLVLKFRYPSKDKNSNGSSYIKIQGTPVDQYKKSVMRRKFMLLKEDPVMFMGTLRENVDPYRYFTDSKIVRVLHFLGLYRVYAEYVKARKQAVVGKALTPRTRSPQPVAYGQKYLSENTGTHTATAKASKSKKIITRPDPEAVIAAVTQTNNVVSSAQEAESKEETNSKLKLKPQGYL